jgi:hypothetical protein
MPESETRQSIVTSARSSHDLEQLTLLLVRAHMDVDIPSNASFIHSVTAPALRVRYRNGRQHDGADADVSREQHLKGVKDWRAQWPDWEMDMWNATGKIKSDGRRAVVWFTMSGMVTKDGNPICLETVHKYSWSRKGGSWVWYRLDSMAGSCGIWGIHSSLPKFTDFYGQSATMSYRIQGRRQLTARSRVSDPLPSLP